MNSFTHLGFPDFVKPNCSNDHWGNDEKKLICGVLCDLQEDNFSHTASPFQNKKAAFACIQIGFEEQQHCCKPFTQNNWKLTMDLVMDQFALVENSAGNANLPWTEAQDAILSDANFETARATITTWPGYEKTPLISLSEIAQEANVASIHYKDEGGRFGLGSFKALGGAYAVARQLQRELSDRLSKPVSLAEVVDGTYSDETTKITVCCATDGNHGRSVAWGAKTFGCQCVIFIHETVSEARKTAIEAYGAEVRRCIGNYDDSVREAKNVAASKGWFVVSDTSYPGYMEVPKDVMQGYEIMAAEAFDEVKNKPTHLFIQTGVGGLAAAVAAQAKRRWGDERPLIILADPDQSACWVETYRAGKPTAVEGDLDTLMAGLACGEISALAWAIMEDHADAAIALPDDAAVEMMKRLAFPKGGDRAIVAGESAVAGLAGLMAVSKNEAARKALALDSNSHVMVFGTEGDTDAELYTQLVGVSGDVIRKKAA